MQVYQKVNHPMGVVYQWTSVEMVSFRVNCLVYEKVNVRMVGAADVLTVVYHEVSYRVVVDYQWVSYGVTVAYRNASYQLGMVAYHQVVRG
jgi:hypothetical protein